MKTKADGNEKTRMFKLTNQNKCSFGGTQWAEGSTHHAPGEGELCTAGWIHVYDSALKAVFMNPIHAAFENPVLWECEVWGNTKADAANLKHGVQHCTTLRQVPLPGLTIEQRIEIAIRVTLCVYEDPAFQSWAESWLSGLDRTEAAAEAAAKAAWAAGAAGAVGAAAWAARTTKKDFDLNAILEQVTQKKGDECEKTS